MRVELIYTPGCSSYKKTLDILETIIAEERLPIPVEITEETSELLSSPRIRIDGDEIREVVHVSNEDLCFQSTQSKLSTAGFPCIEQLRNLLSKKWQDLTSMAILET